MGKYKKADTLYQKSLELNKKIKGDKHPDIANEYNNIADLYKLMGRYNEAETLYKEGKLGVNQIATQLGIAKNTLYKYLRHRGVEINAYNLKIK